MVNKKNRTKALIFMLSLTMSFSAALVSFADDSSGAPQSQNTPQVSIDGDTVKMTFGNEDFVKKIKSITLGETTLTEFISPSNFPWASGFRAAKGGKLLQIGGITLKPRTTFVISSEGSPALSLTVNEKGEILESTDGQGSQSGGSEPGQDKTPETPDVKFENSNIILEFRNIDNYLSQVKELSINGQKVEKVSSSLFPWGSGSRYTVESNTIKIGGVELDKDAKLKIKAQGYKDLEMALKAGMEPTDGKKLHVRLKGSFESAVVNQQGYDAVSGASTNVIQNKNSDVVVQAALLDKDKAPVESDWKTLKDSKIKLNLTKTKAVLSDSFGMKAIYSPFDSSLTLSGIPNNAGEYTVSIELCDEDGHMAVSNKLPFTVYTGNEYLADRLKEEFFKKTQDNKYMWDMEPWTIRNFNRIDNVVTVPKDLKAWFGSHESGTYGKLGYPVPFGSPTTQTLVIPSGCHLTLINMDILSSVRIVVKSGASLTLRGTPVQGICEVESGGTLSMNYTKLTDGVYEYGSAINGQLILQNGATLQNAAIYSNTNFIPNGSGNGEYERINTAPVVVAKGKVNIKGTVVIKGDEAASYQGQQGLLVENGSLNIEKGAILAVYGGGKSATTSLGGNAITLKNAAIEGKGKLIAIGGAGFTNNGGHAVTGEGVINVAKAFLQGGSVISPKNSSVMPGKSITENVKLSPQTGHTVIEGELGKGTNVNTINEFYWNDITKLPDFSKYTINQNAPNENTENENQAPQEGYSSNAEKPKASAANVTSSENKTAVPDKKSDKAAPATGDSNDLLLMGLLFIASSGIIAVISQRKRTPKDF